MEDVLPPLPEEKIEGVEIRKEEAPVHRDLPLPKRCLHKGKVTLVSSTELKCQCGTGWSGPNIHQLYELLKNA